MTKLTITRERMEEIILDNSASLEEFMTITRMALATMRCEPVYQCEFCHADSSGELQWHWEDVNKDFYEQYGSGHRGQRRILYSAPQSGPVVGSEPVAAVLSSRPGNDTSTIDRALPVGTQLYLHAQPAPVAPYEVMPGGLVYSSALPKFESNDSDKVVGYCCFISGETRSVESQEQAYADAKAVVNACRAAMFETSNAVRDLSTPVDPDCKQQETNIPTFYVDGEAAIRLLKGHTRFAAMTAEPKSGKTLALYINAQSASVIPAEPERKGKRLRVAEGRYAAYFPQERPLDGAQIIAWDEKGNLLGVGFGRDTRDTGIAIIVNGKKYDSNHVIHWCS